MSSLSAIKFFFRNVEFIAEVRYARGFRRAFGLMFRSANCDVLCFDFDTDVGFQITSLFVFFPFLAIWLDGKNKVIDFTIVRPFTFSVRQPKRFRKLLEVPVNGKNQFLVDFFVDKQRKI